MGQFRKHASSQAHRRRVWRSAAGRGWLGSGGCCWAELGRGLGRLSAGVRGRLSWQAHALVLHQLGQLQHLCASVGTAVLTCSSQKDLTFAAVAAGLCWAGTRHGRQRHALVSHELGQLPHLCSRMRSWASPGFCPGTA